MKSSDEEFIKALKEDEFLLNRIGFVQSHFERKGYAVFTEYQKQDIRVKFMCGPSDWHVDMIIVTPKQRYAFGDLLQIPVVDEWVKRNKFSGGNEHNIKAEVDYFVNLLEFVLPILK